MSHTLPENLQISALLLLLKSSTVCLCSAMHGQGSLATALPGPSEPQGSSAWTHPMAYGSASVAPLPPLSPLHLGDLGHHLCLRLPRGVKTELAGAWTQLNTQGEMHGNLWMYMERHWTVHKYIHTPVMHGTILSHRCIYSIWGYSIPHETVRTYIGVPKRISEIKIYTEQIAIIILWQYEANNLN